MRGRLSLVVVVCLALGCEARSAQQAAPRATAEVAAVTAATGAAAAPPPRPASVVGFLKGQLHAHTGNSGDSETDPAVAARWYAERGYDFVVFTDHNVVTELGAPPGMLLFRGVELTQNLMACDPAPEPGERCLLHVNGLFVGPEPGGVRFDSPSSFRRVDLYGRAVDRALSMGGLAQINHPNFHHGADLAVVLAMAGRGATLMEVENKAVDSDNEGDARHPSTEALWDAALSKGARLFATATDDAHHYEDAARVSARGEIAYVGDRGFVMVRAEKTMESIRAALASGAFYASTGVLLRRVEMRRDGIDVEVAPESGACAIEVIADGRVVESVRGSSLRWDPRLPGTRWARVRVVDGVGKKALTQPVWF